MNYGFSYPTINWSIVHEEFQPTVDVGYFRGICNSLLLLKEICQSGMTAGVNSFFLEQGKVNKEYQDYHFLSLFSSKGVERVLILRHPNLIKRVVDVKRREIACGENDNLVFSAESELGAPFRDAMMGILSKRETHDAFRILARAFLDPKRLDTLLRGHVKAFLDENLPQHVAQTLPFHTLTARIMTDALLDEKLSESELATLINDINYLSDLIYAQLLFPHSPGNLKQEARIRLGPLLARIETHAVIRNFNKDSSLSEDDLREATIAFLFAGIDNMAWALHHLFVALGDETIASLSANRFLTDKERLSIIQESLRLWPVIYGLRRDVVRALNVTISSDKKDDRVVLD